MELSRRLGLKIALGGVSAAALAGSGVANAAVDQSKDAKAMFRKLRYRADEGLVFWWLKGTKYGQVGPELKPIFDMQVGSFMRTKNTPDGGYDVTSLELVFYTDLATGEFMREWTNPYNGKTLRINHGLVGPTTIHFTKSGDQVMPTEIGGAKLESVNVIGPPLIVGDDIWIKQDSTAAVMPADAKGAPFRVNDWSTYLGRIADLNNAAMPFAPATVYLQEATSWQRWMMMGDAPGGLTSRAVGRKVATYAEMPEAWRKLVADIDPDVAKDPHASLDRPSAKFER